MVDLAMEARRCGFHTAAPMRPDTLEFLPEVRGMCASDRCRHYGKSWACPPACGDLAYWRDRCSRYGKGLLLQTVGKREDAYDYESIMETERENKRQTEALADRLAELRQDFLLLAAGTCTRCGACTYPDAPCRYPNKLFPSMEACGLLVSKVCADNGVPYYYGAQGIAFTCCVLYNG